MTCTKREHTAVGWYAGHAKEAEVGLFCRLRRSLLRCLLRAVLPKQFDNGAMAFLLRILETVSYTHLTLPTKA